MKLSTRDLNVKLFRVYKFSGKLSNGRKLNYMYCCTGKPYDILRAKDTKRKSITAVLVYVWGSGRFQNHKCCVAKKFTKD